MVGSIAQSVMEDANLAWFRSLGYTVFSGPDIDSGELFTKQAKFSDAVLMGGRPCLAALRDALLPKLISGELRVKPDRVLEWRTQ